jgi:alanine racemase
VPIVGAVSMDMMMVDVTGLADVSPGDEVVIIGRQGDEEITIAEVAKRHGLGLHHVATTVGPRVTRVYRSAAATSPA